MMLLILMTELFIGNPNPKFTYGLNLGFTYKNFDLTAFVYGSQGNDIFNGTSGGLISGHHSRDRKARTFFIEAGHRQSTGAVSTQKHPIQSNFSTNTVHQAITLEDGSFTRLKNLQLGYTIPTSTLSKINIKGLRIYVQGINLFTITKYSGLDPRTWWR